MLILLVIPTIAVAQSDYVPFAEADRSIARLENEGKVFDSLRKEYQHKLVFNLIYGQRGIARSSRSAEPDTVTFVDFADRRSIYGIGIGYYVRPRLYIGAEISFLMLPREQEISSVSFGANGLTAEGRGNGGAEMNLRLITQYFLKQDGFTRPYVRLALGRVNLAARGGEISVQGGQRDGELNEIDSKLGSLQVAGGVNHRASPGFAIDWYLGYTATNQIAPVGGIVSTGGWNTALSLQFILNPRNRQKTK